MKKILSIIYAVIAFLIIYFLQSNFFSWFTIAGISPNLFIIFILFIGLFLGKYFGFVFGIVFGLILDLFIGKTIGTNAICLGIGGLLGGYLSKNFSKEKRLTLIFMVIISTIVAESIKYIIQILVYKSSLDIVFIKVIIIEVIYNVILLILIYPLFQKLGNKITEIFEGKEKFIKYF